jgi:hypothetical protein
LERFAVAYLGITLLAGILLASHRGLRPVWKELRLRDLAVYAALTAAAVGVSLGYSDAIANHAWRPHEEQLWFAFRAEVPEGGVWHSLETQVLLRLIYTQLGTLVPGRSGPFVTIAMILGTGGVVFAGVAAQLLTRRPWIGYATAAILVVSPSLAYWRTNAFHIAPPHATFCATLLCAVLVARKVDFRTCAAWMICGSLTLFLRMELAGAVVGTAAIPLFCGPRGGFKQVRAWLPALVIAAALLTWPTLENLGLAAEREDYRTGMRMIPFYLQISALWLPMSSLAMVPLIALGLFAAAPRSPVDPELKAAARAMSVLLVLGVVPAITFISFGQRHILASGTAGAILACIGPAALMSVPRLRDHARLIAVGATVLGIGVVASSHGVLTEWSARYGTTENTAVPLLPGHTTPQGRPEFDRNWCATYTSHGAACGSWASCHPPKDLTDPVLVRNRWDSHDGCVVWGIDRSDGEVAGARHEWWTVARGMYEWESLGTERYDDNGYVSDIHIYRLKERP